MATARTSDTVELDGQYRLLREEAGLVDRSDRGVLVVGGSEAAEFLQGQLTNDIEALGPNEGCYAALLDRKGHMQADMRVLSQEGAGRIRKRRRPRLLDRHRARRDERRPPPPRHVQDRPRRRARGRVRQVGDHVADRPARRSQLSGVPPVSPEHANRSHERDGIELVAVATDLGVDLISAAGDRDALHASLARDGIAEVSVDAAEILRVESGRPRFGAEMSAATIPQEAGINERAVSFTKGCYIGQETVARLHYKGKPNRHLRGLRLEAAASAGEPVSLDGREIGSVGTAVISPAEGPLALAILRREASPGDQVTVGESTPATVVELPFVR